MWGVRACRVCLASGVRLHGVDPQARAPSLYHCYRDISGIAWSHGVQFLCYECAWQLRKAHGLRERSLRAHSLLEALFHSTGEVTEADILAIDRAADNFKSPLKVCIQEAIDVTDEGIMECSINNHLKIELEGAIVEGEGKMWLRGIDTVKQEVHEDEWRCGDISPALEHNVEVTEWKEKRKNKKSKKAKFKKKAVTLAQADDKKREAPRPQPPAVRRKTKKELAAFYSRFVSVAPMTQQDAYDEMKKRLDMSDRRAPAYKCELCHKGFWRAATHEKHMAKHDPKNGDFECDYCHFRFGNRHSLLDHFRHFHNLRFSCKRCAYTCTNRNLARQHEAWHNGTLYSCKHCNTNFSHYGAMQSHVRREHALELPCRLCGRCFVGRRGVRAHTLRAHAGQARADGEPVGCDPCGVQFASADAFRRHLLVSARHGLADTTVACAACGEACASRADLRRHRRSQHAHQAAAGGAAAAAAAAGTAAAAGPGGARRPRARRPRPDMVCETCGKVFHTNWDFDTHRRKHTGEKPFKCKFCSKAFALKGILKVHLRSHTQEKPHSCEICNKAFAERSNMLRHMQVHSDSKPVACEVCEKEFKNASSLKVHVKYVHLKRPYPLRRRRAPPPPPAAALTPVPGWK